MKKTNTLLTIGAGLVFAFTLNGCGGTTTVSNNARPANAPANATNAKAPTPAPTLDMSKAPSGASPANFKGGATATVVVEEFADYQCPTCGQVYPLVQQLHAAFGDRVKFVFRNYPLTQLHPNAYNAAVAAEAAGLQGRFWEMQNQLFTNQQTWSTASDPRKTFEEYAQKIGIDVQKFGDDMAGMVAKKRVDDDLTRARALNINSTPSFFVNGKPLPVEALGSFNQFKQVIDTELAQAQPAGAAVNTAPTAVPVANTANAAPAANMSNAGAANAANAAPAKK